MAVIHVLDKHTAELIAAGAQGVDMVQIILRPDLTGGVANECRGDILCFNARAVVADLDQLHAA